MAQHFLNVFQSRHIILVIQRKFSIIHLLKPATRAQIDIMGHADLFHCCNEQWQTILSKALQAIDQNYLAEIQKNPECLPAMDSLFKAFSLPLDQTQYLLLGESPYPRPESANGYAFWDNSVHSLWSEKGLSKEVNKATSLRNWIKMLLHARGDLQSDFSQASIARLNKNDFVQTAEDLFLGMMKQGILLLNASLIYSKGKVPYHARHWQPFIANLLSQLAIVKPNIQLILLGNIAKTVPKSKLTIGLLAEHPYNISFITNPSVLDFFKPLDLLYK